MGSLVLSNMFVNHDNAAFYLSERGLVPFESVVEGDFVIADQSSRNRNLKILRERSPAFFIKQVTSQQPHYIKTLRREAACYRMAWEDPRFGALADLMPKLQSWDEASLILVIELLPHAETLWEHHLRLEGFPTETARMQGQKLGIYHARFPSGQLVQGGDAFERQVPWILSIHETNPQYLQQMSRSNNQLVAILHQYPQLGEALTALKESWTKRVLIHGDIKWENLVLTRRDPSDPPQLKIVDWEMADVGDDCWDAGAVFQAYLSFWIFNLPLQSGVALDQAIARSRFKSEEMQPAMAAFWKAYSGCRGLSAESDRILLQRSVQCAAARMIQTAYEGIQRSPDITPHALCQLQMSMNMLQDPAVAVREMIGL